MFRFTIFFCHLFAGLTVTSAAIFATVSVAAAAPVDQQIAARHARLKTTSRELKAAFQLNLQSYKVAMAKALDEALPKILELQSTHIAQNCANGVNRKTSCALFRIDAIRVLEKSYETYEVGRSNNSFVKHAWSLFEDAARTGAFEPVPVKPHEPQRSMLRMLFEFAMFDEPKFVDAQEVQGEIADAFLLHRARLNAADSILSMAVDEPLKTFSAASEGEKFDIGSALRRSFVRTKTAIRADYSTFK